MKSLKLLIIGGMLAYASLAGAQSYPLMTIQQVQTPSNLGVTDASDFVGDTVRVAGVVATTPRSIWIGGRWSFFLVNTGGGPWSGIQVVQQDSFATATDVGLVVPGDSIIVTGLVAEFDGGTQLEVITVPPIPIEFVDQITFATPFPQKVTDVTIEDLQSIATGEQWEETIVRLTNVRVLNSDLGGGQASIESADGAFQLVLEDWKVELRDCLFEDTCEWPPNSWIINVTGFIRDRQPFAEGVPRYIIAPWSIREPYIEIVAKAALVENMSRDPVTPSSSDAVNVAARITDDLGLTSAFVFYSVDDGAWQSLGMSPVVTDSFSATIPAQAEGSVVKYYIEATNEDGITGIVPGDTLRSPAFYFVRNGILSIQDIQNNPFGGAVSGYTDMEVTTSGIVTSTPAQWGNYWIQNGNGIWSGLRIDDFFNNPVPGDEVQVTGTISESNGFTHMLDTDTLSFQLLSTGNTVPAPRVIDIEFITTRADSSEFFEGVLVEVRNLVVSDSLPDAPDNFGEFEVNDGTGSIRIDDGVTARDAFPGNFPVTFHNGDSIRVIRGNLVWSFGNMKITPRDSFDVIGHVKKIVSVRDEGGFIPEAFSLSQNFPNPFNPETELNYSLPVSGEVKLVIYNLLGQQVVTLVDEFQPSGNYSAKWNGRDDLGRLLSSGVYFYRMNVDNGKFTDVKKMLLLK